MPMTAAYLDTLNSEQRRAVEHGLSQQDCTIAGPLLVIAGAGSGKTNTLVARFSQIEGYKCLSLTRALDVVKCQLALA